jgi:hypothetical protein
MKLSVAIVEKVWIGKLSTRRSSKYDVQRLGATFERRGDGGHMHNQDTRIGKSGCILIITTILLSLPLALAQEPARTADVDSPNSLMGAVNEALRMNDAVAFSNLFIPDADLWVGGEQIGKGPGAIQGAVRNRGVWSEVTPAQLDNAAVRLISPDVALIDAKYTRYGSLVLKRTVPVLLVVKHENGVWRIISMRFVSSAQVM